MRTKLKFTRFKHRKDLEELVYEVSHWTSDLEFIKLELDFIKNLLKSYPFKKNISNLFERIQLYKQKIDTLLKSNNDLLKDLNQHAVNLNEIIAYNKGRDDKMTTIKHDNLDEMLFDFKQDNTAFKREVYEYIQGIVK